MLSAFPFWSVFRFPDHLKILKSCLKETTRLQDSRLDPRTNAAILSKRASTFLGFVKIRVHSWVITKKGADLAARPSCDGSSSNLAPPLGSGQTHRAAFWIAISLRVAQEEPKRSCVHAALHHHPSHCWLCLRLRQPSLPGHRIKGPAHQTC